MFKLYQSPCQEKRDQWLRSGIKGARHSANILNYIMYKKLDDQGLWFDPRREHDFLFSKYPNKLWHPSSILFNGYWGTFTRVKPTTHLHPMLRLQMSHSPSPLLHTPSAHSEGQLCLQLHNITVHCRAYLTFTTLPACNVLVC